MTSTSQPESELRNVISLVYPQLNINNLLETLNLLVGYDVDKTQKIAISNIVSGLTSIFKGYVMKDDILIALVNYCKDVFKIHPNNGLSSYNEEGKAEEFDKWTKLTRRRLQRVKNELSKIHLKAPSPPTQDLTQDIAIPLLTPSLVIPPVPIPTTLPDINIDLHLPSLDMDMDRGKKRKLDNSTIATTSTELDNKKTKIDTVTSDVTADVGQQLLASINNFIEWKIYMINSMK